MSGPGNIPAFPFQHVAGDGSPTEPCNGMTLRDWFAGQVMPVFAALVDGDGEPLMGAGDVAKAAYNHADAMIAASAKGGDA